MIDEYRKAYREEAGDLLGELESSLLELEQEPENDETLAKVFRTMHTIKGSGAMFGFDDVAGFTHELETAFDLVRKGRAKISKKLIDLTLLARDLIRGMIEAAFGGEKVDEAPKRVVIEGVRQVIADIVGGRGPVEDAAIAPVTVVNKKEATAENDLKTFRIRFRPHADLYRHGTNPLLLIGELRELGDARVVGQVERIPHLDEADPESCYFGWDVILSTTRGQDAIRDVFIFVEDDSDLKIERVDAPLVSEPESPPKKLGEILVERGDLEKKQLDQVLGEHKKLGEMLVQAGVADPGKVEAALMEQQHLADQRKKKQQNESLSSIRVASERLDHLVNLIGELVTVQARLSQTAGYRHDPELIAIAETVERLTADLRDSALNIRMMPIGSTFSKFKRLVRDLSNELGKDVEMTTDGAETELDKTVIEKLNDPLVHLIRNSIDHGIEMPDERRQKGKTRVGTVHLSAEHSGAHVYIKIRDDGKGLDREAIRGKAVERGLLQPQSELSDKELLNLIFLPGFTTAKLVTSVSGRGVGMDVVKRAIEELRGSIDIASETGVGSVITIKLPLTLAIIDGLLVQISDRFFVLPLSTVQECVELGEFDIQKGHGKPVAIVRGEMVPYVRLRERFAIEGNRPVIEQIVITEVEGNRIGFVVDHVIGEHQTVIKTLGRFYRDVEGLSGATILGDGSVALILDINKLYSAMEREAEA